MKANDLPMLPLETKAFPYFIWFWMSFVLDTMQNDNTCEIFILLLQTFHR